MASRWWDFGGDTLVRADKYVRLAADQPSQSGWIFSRIPLTANNFEIEMEFSIAGKGNLHGDGFAMWITKERAQPGDVFGHTDNFEGLGVFFDTYKNNRPGVVFPYVMAMIGDGKTTYDRSNDGKANELGGCSVSDEKPDFRQCTDIARHAVYEERASRRRPSLPILKTRVCAWTCSTRPKAHGQTAST